MIIPLTMIDIIINKLILLESSRELERNYTIMPLTIIDKIVNGLKKFQFILEGFWKISGLFIIIKSQKQTFYSCH